MVPAFEIEGGLALAVARGLSVVGLLGTFGCVVVRAAVMPPALAALPSDTVARIERQWRALVWGALVLALIAGAMWLWLVSATLANDPGFVGAAATLPVVVRTTLFGHAWMLRMALLLFTGVAVARGWIRAACGLAALAVATQAVHSHAAAMIAGPSVLLLSALLHLLAAGAWLGGLLPLWLVVRRVPSHVAGKAARRFGRLGILCVLVLTGTALVQFDALIGGLPGLIGTGYGLAALAKMALFAALLVFAAVNRWRLVPALDRFGAKSLEYSILIEAALGLLVVLVAGLLGSLAPAMHTQPIWPFALRPSLVTVNEDPDFRREVAAALLALASAGVMLVLAACLRRRVRWLLVISALAIGWFAAPHLRLLLVEANPDSYAHSPTGFSVASIARGAALYPAHCASCHGVEGRGDGPAAAGLPVPPANLTEAHLFMYSDGDVFWWLSHGIATPEGQVVMPGFANELSETERWNLIDAVRARNAGLAARGSGVWPRPIHAPGLQVTSAAGLPVTLSGLRGQMVRLVFSPVLPPPAADVVTVAAPADTDAVAAYAAVSGLAAAQVPGAEFLIDAQGWLRAMRPSPGWPDATALAQALSTIRATPISASDGMSDDMAM